MRFEEGVTCTMAAFHFTAKIHSRARGASAVRAAAYRAAERLLDERAGHAEDYSRKSDVIESAILAPAGAAGWVQDRQALWNRVEARERRKDAQIAQELEINLPRELSEAENWRLAVDFARAHLVAHGRICDINFHVGAAGDGGAHPHIHILMPLRQLAGDGFGEKHLDCDWRTFKSRRDRLEELRAAWCDFSRARAAELGIDLGPTWDHRSFEARGIDLEPQPKVGATAQRRDHAKPGQRRPDERTASERAAEFEKTRRENGARLLANPEIALTALTQRHSTFSAHDLARWIHQHAADDQFAAAYAAAQARIVSIGRDEAGQERYSSKTMIALEARMVATAGAMAEEHKHGVSQAHLAQLATSSLSFEQRDAAAHLLQSGDLACLIGYAGAGKSTLLREARCAWEAQGYTVRGAALSGIAAENLAQGSGIEARTLASLAYAWDDDREQLTARDVLVIDEAGMVGSRELARVIERARAAGAKVVLVGDPEQLQAIDAGAAYRAIAGRTGAAQLTEIYRQRADWQREATRELATGRTAEALARYQAAGAIDMAVTDEAAQEQLVRRWRAATIERPDASRVMLAHRNLDVQALNQIARAAMRKEGRLEGPDFRLATNRGARDFARGDRLLFLRNDRALGVRNGTLGTIERLGPDKLIVRADDGRRVEIDPRAYQDIDHGYALTTHKAQGVTVDETYVLATRGFDRHLAYVACSRHRDRLTIVHSRDAFADGAALAATLSRERLKDTTLDYREAQPTRPAVSIAPAQARLDELAAAYTGVGSRQASTEQAWQDAARKAGAGERDWNTAATRADDPERQWERRPRDRDWSL